MRAFAGLTAATLVLTAAALDAQRESPLPFSPADADRFTQKLALILENAGSTSGRPGRPARITVTEPEVNAYLRYRARDLLPAGVVEPAVLALGDGRVAGAATVDLDAVRVSRSRGWLDPMQLLRGRLLVNVSGVLRARGGTARFELESASIGGVPVPKSLVQELVGYYTRTAAHPEGLDLDAPFDLPAGVRDITVQSGRALIVQ